jgi:hypothetical protein
MDTQTSERDGMERLPGKDRYAHIPLGIVGRRNRMTFTVE